MAELAFDLGQTQARVRLITETGASELELDGFRYGTDAVETVLSRCTAAAATFGVTTIRAVAGGVTGLYGLVPDLRELRRSLAESLGVARVTIADDAVSSHLGALVGEPGTLVAAGTGIVGLGIGPSGVARVDGVGSMIGDEGSGWWIGRRGMIGALSSHDGRSGGSALLLDALQRRYGPADRVPALIAASPSPVGFVASFAPTVAEAAREGDLLAEQIWAEAARHIGDAVVAASSRAGFERDARFPWAITGRLTGAADLLDPVLNSIVSDRFPAAFRTQPVGSALDGAQRLLHYPNLNTLAPLVGVSATEKDTDD